MAKVLKKAKKELPLPVEALWADREKLSPAELREVLATWARPSVPKPTLEPIPDDVTDEDFGGVDLDADIADAADEDLDDDTVYVIDENARPRHAAARLKWLAFQLDLTQKEIAKRVGVSPVVINRIFKNPDRSTVATLRKIAKAMNVTLFELIGE